MELRYGTLPDRAKVLRTTADLHLSWDVAYEPGALRAVGTRNRKVAATVEVSTTGEPAAIDLSADREVIAADGRDVVHCTVRIVDDKGAVVPDADHEITFDLDGDGKLVGVDSGDPRSHEDYKSNRRRAFHGFSLAIVRSTGRPGQIRLRAASPSLKAASVTVATKV